MSVQFVTFSNLIIDDIVLPDGRTFMNTLGGAGLHALVGMRVRSDQLGYVAAVGSDLPPEHREALQRFGVDLRGLIEHRGYRTARAWQLFEPDERRIEIFRTDLQEFNRYKCTFEDIPTDYLEALGFHLDWGDDVAELNTLVERLRANNPNLILVCEPNPMQLEGTRAEYETLFRYIDAFSPNGEDAQQITGQNDPKNMTTTLLDWGARCVALRLGAEGSLVGTAQGELWRVPAFPAAIVDVTGAGNSYCGGFVTGLGHGKRFLEAALRAAVSASFAIEQFGLPQLTEGLAIEANKRLHWVRERAQEEKL